MNLSLSQAQSSQKMIMVHSLNIDVVAIVVDVVHEVESKKLLKMTLTRDIMTSHPANTRDIAINLIFTDSDRYVAN